MRRQAFIRNRYGTTLPFFHNALSRRTHITVHNILPYILGSLLYTALFVRTSLWVSSSWLLSIPQRRALDQIIDTDVSNANDEVEISLNRRFLRSVDDEFVNVEVFRIARHPTGSDRKKLVGLVEVKNVAHVLHVFLEELSKVVDSIVLLDDFSTDDTRRLLFEKPFKIELLLKKRGKWVRDELDDRKVLLKYGRSVGGTHFVLLDYDEYFSDNCVRNGLLRTEILKMKPGQSMYLKWVEVWKYPTQQRVLPDDHNMNFLRRRQSVVFADDGKVQYDFRSTLARSLGSKNASLHVLRCPRTLCPSPGKYRKTIHPHSNDSNVVYLDNCRIMEFRFLNLANTLLKAAWYEALGRINGARDGQTSGKMLASLFPPAGEGGLSGGHKVTTVGISLELLPRKLLPKKLLALDEHPYGVVERWRAAELIEWRELHGERFFDNLTATSMIDFATLKSVMAGKSPSNIHDVPRKKIGALVVCLYNHNSIAPNGVSVMRKVLAAFGGETILAPEVENLQYTDLVSKNIGLYEKLQVVVEGRIRSAIDRSPSGVAVYGGTVERWSNYQWEAWMDICRRGLPDIDVVYVVGSEGFSRPRLFDLKRVSEIFPGNARIFQIEPSSLTSLAGISLFASRLFLARKVSPEDREEYAKLAEECFSLIQSNVSVARLIFSNNVGRSGSAYLADLFNTTGRGIMSLHEPRCPASMCSGGGAFAMQNRTLSSTYIERKAVKIPMIRKALAELVRNGPDVSMRTVSCNSSYLPTPDARQFVEFGLQGCTIYSFRDFVYAETNPNFKSWIYDVVLDTFPDRGYDVFVINLRKYVPAVVRSLYETGYFTRRDGYKWMETANSVNSKVVPLGHDKDLNAIEKLTSYVINAEAVTREMVKMYIRAPNVYFIDVRSEQVLSREGSFELLRRLDLRPSARTEFVAGKRVDKYDGVNSKRVQVPHKSLSEVEREVGNYMKRYQKLPRSMKLIAHLKRFEGFKYRE